MGGWVYAWVCKRLGDWVEWIYTMRERHAERERERVTEREIGIGIEIGIERERETRREGEKERELKIYWLSCCSFYAFVTSTAVSLDII